MRRGLLRIGVAHHGFGQRVLALPLHGGHHLQQLGLRPGPSAGTKSVTAGSPRVMVPVLSSSTVFTW